MLKSVDHWLQTRIRRRRVRKTHSNTSTLTIDKAEKNLIRASSIFDEKWYSLKYPEFNEAGLSPLDHYLAVGWRKGFSPGPTFDASWYLATYPDVAAANYEPLSHYIRHGSGEGRQIKIADPEAIDPKTLGVELDAGLVRAASSFKIDPQLLSACLMDVQGRDYLEVNYHGYRSLHLLTQALACGARSARILSPYRPARAGAMLSACALSRPTAKIASLTRNEDEIEAFSNAMWREKDTNSWFVLGDMNEVEARNKIGTADFIVSLSALYHHYEPLAWLRRLAWASQDIVCFDVPIVASFETILSNGVKVVFKEDDLWCAGSMSADQSQAIAKYWRDLDVPLEQYVRFPGGVTPEIVWRERLSGVWWWFFGEKSLDILCELAGLEIIDRKNVWGGRTQVVRARKRATPASLASEAP